ncbi:hypothetical protein HOU02_gp310 [Caulobacter phage CcrBL9]|uniref:Uncharacterized protein n=1 Tax=Caulobacter phage CcrBL9 TaxID=2283270 RepID=A0A385EEG6_9CAUD|nr:hypothetical protein HOU02_gp310 [Caulobacter phage CcrBL9]AXQ69415.1 hypothetical protein CcrBL9_gp391 [Caulobacter phage CcrBL9]
MTAPYVTRALIIVDKEVANPNHDRRVKHGEDSLAKLTVGERLVVSTADYGTHQEVTMRRIGANTSIWKRAFVEAIQANASPIEPETFAEWAALTGDEGEGINRRMLEILFQTKPDIVKKAHASAVARYDEFND